jgi:diguanylate cyclase (GGDEF)-like protein
MRYNSESERLRAVITAQKEIAAIAHKSVGDIMHFVAHKMQELTSAGSVIVEMLEGDDRVYRAVTDDQSILLGTRSKATTGLSGMCLNTGMILYCKDSEKDNRVDLKNCRRLNAKSLVVVPLKYENKINGLLKLTSPFVCAFSDEDILLLELMAEYLAISLERAKVLDQLRNKSKIDTVTGLLVRRYGEEELRNLVQKTKEKNSVLSFILLDVDDFKHINDSFGHSAGDSVLQQMGELLNKNLRKTDVAIRWGGEEILILLPSTSDGGAINCANRLRKIIEAHNFNVSHIITVSGGVSSLYAEDNEAEVIKMADINLYKAKNSGKNRIISDA